jgi:hypothetical protein
VFRRFIEKKLADRARMTPSVENAFNELTVAVNETLIFDLTRAYEPRSMQRPSKEVN